MLLAVGLPQKSVFRSLIFLWPDPDWNRCCEWGMLPTDVIQALFVGLDPSLAVRKFRAFARMDPTSDRATRFVALEDWLNDGVPLAAPVARQCFDDWYGANRPVTDEWRIAGRAILPSEITVPSLAVVPATDRIVPPSSASALADALPDCDRLSPPLGHIGMTAAKPWGGKPTMIVDQH